MALTIIILSIILLSSILIIISYRRQIKNICRLLSFRQKHDSNLIITQQTGSQDFTVLIKEINNLIASHNKLQQQYGRSDRQLKETITSLSHDIRTPLTSLDGYLQLLESSENDQDREKYVSIMQNRINSLKDMLEELFTYAKMQDVNYSIELAEYSLNKLLLDTLFSFYEDFKSKGIEPVIQIPDDEIIVLCNQEGMRRVFQNIIKNGLVHGEKQIEISLLKEENHAEIIFKNLYSDAQHIDADHVFDRFYKADKARSNNSTGLGLSIAKELTMKMGGEIYSSAVDNIFEIRVKFEINLGVETCGGNI